MFDGIRSISQAPGSVSLPIHVYQENPLLAERAHHRTTDGGSGFSHASFLVGIHIAFHTFLLRTTHIRHLPIRSLSVYTDKDCSVHYAEIVWFRQEVYVPIFRVCEYSMRSRFCAFSLVPLWVPGSSHKPYTRDEVLDTLCQCVAGAARKQWYRLDGEEFVPVTKRHPTGKVPLVSSVASIPGRSQRVSCDVCPAQLVVGLHL